MAHIDDKEIKNEPIMPEDEEFADAGLTSPIEAIEEVAEEEEAEVLEPEVVEEEKPTEAPKLEPLPENFEYNDPNLEGIEIARSSFYKAYKGMGKWTLIPTVLLLAGIICAWILPTYVWPENGTIAIGVTLGVVGVMLVAMIVLSIFKKKKTNTQLKAYFKQYYEYTNRYVFDGTSITNLEGDIDNKITLVELQECDLYKDLTNASSRGSFTFNYHGHKCGIVDTAGQIRGTKALQTVFVGKYFRANNNYKGSPIVIYLKGNSRALPPTNIDDMPILLKDNSMIVRGEESAKKVLTKKVKDAIKAFKTDDVLVDLCFKVEEGKTFILFGYEDTLMVLPMEHAFNPGPTEHFKKDFRKALDFIDALDGRNLKGHEVEEVKEEPTKEVEEVKAEA